MTERDHEAGGHRRWATALIGVLFVGVAVAIVFAAREAGLAAYAAAAVVGALGVEALVCAARNRRCLLSRIGPLP